MTSHGSQLNWRRGFFRAWLLIAILWVLGTIIVMWPDTMFARLFNPLLIVLTLAAITVMAILVTTS